MSPVRPVTAAGPRRDPHRFRLSRAGIHQVWQYDSEFRFGDGRLLLRGKNGAGKSKALEMLLPFLLDGDTRRLDAGGGGKTTLKWLMLDGWDGGRNRLGYLWAEFARITPEGETVQLTVGAAIKASVSTGEARPLFFVTPLAVGDDFPLHDPDRRPAPERLRDLIGPENCYERAADYRGKVARELFGLTDSARYRNLVHLLYGLRKPTIGDRIESGELVKVLSDALPPLDEEVVDKVARNLDDLDSVRSELARLEQTNTALTTFLASYRGYLRGVLRGRVGQVRAALDELGRRRRKAGDAERELARLKTAEQQATEGVTALEQARDAADTDLRTLRESAAYAALRDLNDRRATVRAVEQAARNAWDGAALARDGEAAAAGTLTGEAEQIGRELADLRGSLRDAREASRECGVDDVLLGELPAARATALAPVQRDQLTDVDGGIAEIARPPARTLGAELGDRLASWKAQLTDTDKVMKARARAAAALAGRLQEAADAERTAAGLRSEAERLDGQLAGAREREAARGMALAAASAAYAADVLSWSARLPVDTASGRLSELVAMAADEALPPPERALAADTPDAVLRLAHDIADPVLAGYEDERDAVIAVERAAREQLTSARAERGRWERQRDPEPPRSGYVPAERPPGPGAPLFLLVDFAGPLGERDRAGLEAGLEASGLLGAWACADGTLLAPGSREVMVQPDEPVIGPRLSDVLRGVPGSGVSATALDRLLASIGLDPSPARSWVGSDGRWRLGVLSGAHEKDRAEYIGAGVREATRQRRLAELTVIIDGLTAELDRATADREDLERRRDGLRLALREVPPSRSLTGAWTSYESAVSEAARLADAVLAARRAAEQATAAAVALRTRAAAQATSDGLPAEAGPLARLRTALDGLRGAVAVLGREAERARARLGAHAGALRSYETARQARAAAELAYAGALAELETRRRELDLLEASVGASEQEIIAREDDAQRRRDAAGRQLPPAQAEQRDARDARLQAEYRRETAIRELAEQEQLVVSGGSGLRRPLGLPGLLLAAELDDVSAPIGQYDDAQGGDVRTRITALGALAADVGGRLGPASADVSDGQIYRRGQDLRDGLAGGYDAESDEIDGIKRFELHDDSGAHDVAVVGARIRLAAAEARSRLSAREQEVFQRYLLGELGDHLSRQVLAAHQLVAVMNDTLDSVRSSHGIGARLNWELRADSDADVRSSVALLRQSAALRTPEHSAQLRDALRRRIEEARLADPSAGYARHLRTALDYRAWFTFRVKVTDTANPDKERVLSHRTALSQGEQRVVSYLVLFATAAAHFSSIAAGAPAAPRLILLDDAFAKVDEPTHARLLGLLVDLDLDFIITSERLWGCFPTVPELHIYECLRDPRARGVAAVHFTWDGHRKRLVGV
jgi:uncharacterized protein (TIGR02680 family)